MKEHPDYKYRPRRKPKTLVKSPNSSSQSNGNHHSNNNSHSNNSHHHSLKGSSSNSPVLSNHHHHSPGGKYPFVPSIDLPISFPSSQHQQQPTGISPSSFPGLHYPLVDPTLALDLQARLQAMYAGVYHPWRYFGCNPIVTNSEQAPPSPPASSIYVCMKSSSPTSSKISPDNATNSPPLIDHCEPNPVPKSGNLKASII